MQYTSKEVYEYISKKANDPIVERKKCRVSWQDFPIYKSDLDFYDKVSPIFEVSEDYAKEFFEKNSDVKVTFQTKIWLVQYLQIKIILFIVTQNGKNMIDQQTI